MNRYLKKMKGLMHDAHPTKGFNTLVETADHLIRLMYLKELLNVCNIGFLLSVNDECFEMLKKMRSQYKPQWSDWQKIHSSNCRMFHVTSNNRNISKSGPDASAMANSHSGSASAAATAQVTLNINGEEITILQQVEEKEPDYAQMMRQKNLELRKKLIETTKEIRTNFEPKTGDEYNAVVVRLEAIQNKSIEHLQQMAKSLQTTVNLREKIRLDETNKIEQAKKAKLAELEEKEKEMERQKQLKEEAIKQEEMALFKAWLATQPKK